MSYGFFDYREDGDGYGDWDEREPDEPLTESEIAEDAIHDAQEADLERGMYDELGGEA